jgi:hypothetical protein
MRPYAAILIILMILIAPNSFAADLERGFMDYTWGQNIKELPNLDKLYAKKHITYYSNPGETYILENIAINDIVFGFYDSQLLGVYIGIDSLEKYDKIMAHMRDKYGLPSVKISSSEKLTTHKWKYKDVTIKLKADQIDADMKLAFYYDPLSDVLRKEKLTEVSDDSFRFFPIDKDEKPRMIPFLEF